MSTSTVAQKRVLQLPYVTYLKRGQACEGRLSKKKPCSKPAHYRFKALRNGGAYSGVFCWIHLKYRGIFSTMEEFDRTLATYYKLGVLCPSVHESGARCAQFIGHDGSHHPTQYQHKEIVDGLRRWVTDDMVTW